MITRPYTKSGDINVFEGSYVSEEDYKESGLYEVKEIERVYFWFRIRAVIVGELAERYVPKSASILEVGSGTGVNARTLERLGYTDISIAEMHRAGLDLCDVAGVTKYCLNLYDFPFKEHFDSIFALDVLEHLEDDMGALCAIYGGLKPNGTFICSVPAHNALLNLHDYDVGHKRRYNKRKLRALLESAGFKVEHISYRFSAITPLLYLRRVLHPYPSMDSSAPPPRATRCLGLMAS